MKVDPYLNEATVDLDPDIHGLYLEARANADAWTAEADRLKTELLNRLGDAHAGLVNGRKVITHRPVATYRIKDLIRDYPELTQHYFTTKEVETFDQESFRYSQPELLEQYRSRSFRSIAEAAG